MNLVAHLARKDLRRILIPGALYAFFLAAKLVLGAFALSDIDAAQFAAIRDYLKIATFAEWVISYVLVAAIIQEDPVVGANAFWMTRPISGLRLLTTKLLVLFALLILLPVLIAFPWWHVCHLDIHSMALAAAHVALLQGLLVGCGLPLAVLTANLARYLAGTLVAVAAWIAVMTSARGRFVSRDSDLLSAGVSDTRGGIFVAILIGTLAILVLHQYRTRRTRRSVTILAAGLTLATTVMAAWRWDWSPLWKSFTSQNALVDAIELDFEDAELLQPSPLQRDALMTVQAHFSAVPAGHILDTLSTRQEWRSPDGTETFLKTQISRPSPLSESIVQKVLGVSSETFADPASADGSHVRPVRSSILAPAAFARAVAEQPFDLTLRVQTRLLRPFLVTKTALQSLGSTDRGGFTLRIQNLETRSDGDLVISIAEIFSPSRRPPLGSYEICLLDEASGRIIPVSESHTEQIPIAGVSIGARTAIFRAAGLNAAATATPVDTGAMIPRLHLVYFGYELVGKVHRTVQVPHVAVTVNRSFASPAP